MKKWIALALVLLFVLIACEASTERATAQQRHRLVIVDNIYVASNGFNWADVWLIRDTETGAEFLITYGKDGNVRVTTMVRRPEVAQR